MKQEILGISFDALTMNEVEEAADRLMKVGTGGYIVTVNTEILLTARKDRAHLDAVGRADLVVADGIGVLYAGRILQKHLPGRVTGSDLTPRLFKRLAERRGSVFLYGAKPGVAERAAENLRRIYPGLVIAGTENGYIKDETLLWKKLREMKPDLLLLGLGFPRQEKWMAANRGKTDALMIGVGGLIDVFAGDVKRAPEIWCRLGFEWLYRLIRQPWRIRRMSKLPLILILACRERLRGGFTDRKAPRRGR